MPTRRQILLAPFKAVGAALLTKLGALESLPLSRGIGHSPPQVMDNVEPIIIRPDFVYSYDGGGQCTWLPLNEGIPEPPSLLIHSDTHEFCGVDALVKTGHRDELFIAHNILDSDQPPDWEPLMILPDDCLADCSLMDSLPEAARAPICQICGVSCDNSAQSGPESV